MNYTYTKDESGKIVSILVNGKPVKKSYLNAFKKAQMCSYWKPVNFSSIAVNPFSDVKIALNPLETAVYNFVKTWERLYHRAVNSDTFPIEKVTETPVSTFDNMRYLFNVLNPGAYMDLLD